MTVLARLGEVADMLVGFAFQSQQFLGPADEGVRLVRGENVQQGFLRWGDKAMKWRHDAYDDLRKYQLAQGDVILAMDRPIVGGGLKLAWIAEHDLPALLVQRVTRIRGLPGKALTNYLRYALSSADFVAHVDRITTGANIPHISGKDIAAFELRLPPIEEQQAILECVSRYDDLIEANRRRIALLEESARLLYREWFVELRFPGHELMKSIDGLPHGWSHQSIASMTSLLTRGIAPTYDEVAAGLVINQKCIREGRLNLDAARRQSKVVKADRMVRIGDVLINSTGAGTLGRVAQVRNEIENCTVDTHVTIVRPIESKTAFFLGVALLELESVFSTMGVGSTNQTELGRADVGAMILLTPSDEVRRKFHDAVEPAFAQIEALLQSNRRMTNARDALLPQLMSGELRV